MSIKKHTFLLICIAALWTLNSCDDGIELDFFYENIIPSDKAYYLKTYTDNIQLDCTEGSTKAMQIYSVDTPWKLNIPNNWLTADLMSGNGEQEYTDVVLTATANPSSYYRLSVFSLESEEKENYDYSQNIVAEQKGTEPEVYVSSANVTMSASASSTTIKVSTNSPKKDVYTNESWLSANLQNDEITISTTENTSNYIRTGRVYINVYQKDGESLSEIKSTFYVEVVQNIPNVTFAESALQFDNDAETKTIVLESDVKWNAYSSDSWIDVTPSEGNSGTITLSVSVTANNSSNTREGSLYVTAGDKTISLTVLQSGFYINSNLSGNIIFTSGIEEKEFELETNLAFWKVIEKPDWLTVSPGNGSKGKTTIKLKTADNPLVSKRTGNLIIGNEGIGYGLTINVEQEGKYFDDIETTLQFGNTASSSTVDIKTNGTWTAKANCDWITLTPTSGTGNSTLSVSVVANESDDERTGRIDVTVGTTTHNINVVQKGRYFIIDRGTSRNISSKGGGIELSIATNQTWKAEVKNNSSWLTLSATTGQGDANLIITAKDNPSLNSRTDTIVFTPANNQGVKLVVVQSGRYLKVDTESIWFFSKGGKAKPVNIDTDGTFRVEKQQDANWLTVTTNNNLLEIEAQPFEGEELRSATISLYLTGLADESSEAKVIDIVVGQYAKNTIFVRNEFGEDSNLEITFKEGAGFTVNDYGEDEDLSAPVNEKGNIDRTEYGEDKNIEL